MHPYRDVVERSLSLGSVAKVLRLTGLSKNIGCQKFQDIDAAIPMGGLIRDGDVIISPEGSIFFDGEECYRGIVFVRGFVDAIQHVLLRVNCLSIVAEVRDLNEKSKENQSYGSCDDFS